MIDGSVITFDEITETTKSTTKKLFQQNKSQQILTKKGDL